MGIRKKISLGFVVIGFILLFSSVIAVFEFNRMRNSVTVLMKSNINSINTSRMLMELTDEYNFILMSRVIVDSTFGAADVLYDDRFDNYIYNIKSNFSSQTEIETADSLALSYSQYLSVISKARNIMAEDINTRKEGYKNELEPTFQERFAKRIPFYIQNPPAKQKLKDENGVSTLDLGEFMNDLKTS